jgi:hypothetical protein
MSEFEFRKKRPYASPKLIARTINDSPRSSGTPISQGNPPASQTAEPIVKDNEQLKAQDMERRANGHALYQEVFFFCTVPNVGDVRGTGCIYVETVVDQNSGCAFAKVYAAKHAMNSADVLFTRVLPFFRRQGFTIRNIHTPRKSEYFGLVPLHPFESLLATSHIEHLSTGSPGAPHNYLCLQFYRFLQKNFFQPILRKKFSFSLEELQKELDAFIDAYNSLRLSHSGLGKSASSAASKFPFDL